MITLRATTLPTKALLRAPISLARLTAGKHAFSESRPHFDISDSAVKRGSAEGKGHYSLYTYDAWVVRATVAAVFGRILANADRQ